MSISNYIDETVQQAQDFIDDDYLTAVGLPKPSKLVFSKAIEMFLKVSRLINRKFPEDNKVELNLSVDGKMLITWLSKDFEKKYLMSVYEIQEDENKRLKVEVSKNFQL